MGIVQSLKDTSENSHKNKGEKLMSQNMSRTTIPHPIEKDYVLEEEIGKGQSSVVLKAREIKTGNLRAVKKMPKNGKNMPAIMAQFQTVRKLDHPNIIKMYQIYEDSKYLYITMELCSGKELFFYMEEKKFFDEVFACQIFIQLVSAVSYLHSIKIMHRDLKLENLILDEKTKIVKIIDFGSATPFYSSEPIEGRLIGTANYMAPEVINRCYNNKCDVWSLGVILYTLLTFKNLFAGEDTEEVLKSVKAFKKLDFEETDISLKAQKLLQSMLVVDLSKRIQVKDIFKSEWLGANMRKTALLESEQEYLVKCLKNMREFTKVKTKDCLQEGILVYINNFIKNSQDDMVLTKCFKHMDKDNDGVLKPAEISASYCEFLKMSKAEADQICKQIMKKIDYNHSNSLDYSEFVLAAMNIDTTLTPKNIDIAFDYLDQDGSGTLSVAELRSKLGDTIDDQLYKKLIQEYDKDKDNEINREEFVSMINRIVKV